MVPPTEGTTSYRDAAITLWGEAGACAHDAYARFRPALPELPEQLPIVIGLTAYGHCIGATQTTWQYGPRISLASWVFPRGQRYVDDIIAHEALHAWLAVTGRETGHESRDWYDAVNRLSPAVLGRDLGARRGSDRRSVRVPNPAWQPGNGEPKTVVRKERADGVIRHGDIARWPHPFRPDDYYDGDTPIRCPAY